MDQCKLTGLVLACGIVLFASVRVKITVAAQGVSRPAQWEATLEAAKKEGKVNIYMYGYGKAAAPSRCRAGVRTRARRKCSSIGISRVEDRWRCKNWAIPTSRPTPRTDIPKDDVLSHHKLV
jgi:hypothetical protein